MQKIVISIKLRKRVRGLVTLVQHSKVADVSTLRTRGKVVEEIAVSEKRYGQSLTCLGRSFLSKCEEARLWPDEPKIQHAFREFRKVISEIAS